LTSGAWQSFPQPHLPKSKNEYRTLFRCGFKYKGFKFLGEFLVDKEDLKNSCWFIYPKYSDFDKKTIVFSDEIHISKYWQRDIYNITINNDRLKHLFLSFRESQIFYSDDLCGTDFKQVIDFMIRK